MTDKRKKKSIHNTTTTTDSIPELTSPKLKKLEAEKVKLLQEKANKLGTLSEAEKKEKARLRKIYNQKLARQKQNERKLDTRRKILIGSTLMTEAETKPELYATINRLLDRYLIRDDDRKLFPEIPAQHRQTKADAKEQEKATA